MCTDFAPPVPIREYNNNTRKIKPLRDACVEVAPDVNSYRPLLNTTARGSFED